MIFAGAITRATRSACGSSVDGRGSIRISVPLSFGLRRVAPLLLDFSRR